MRFLNSLLTRLILVTMFSVFMASPTAAADKFDTTMLREAVTLEGVRAHQEAFQAIADANGGIRTSGAVGPGATQAFSGVTGRQAQAHPQGVGQVIEKWRHVRP